VAKESIAVDVAEVVDVCDYDVVVWWSAMNDDVSGYMKVGRRLWRIDVWERRLT
jgi:hypothetical protein